MVQPSTPSSSASPSPLEKLPEEILHAILARVRYTSTTSSFVACLLCCRHWCDVGLPLLYHAILLRNSNIETFLAQFPQARGDLVRCLTITIGPEVPATDQVGWYIENWEHMEQNGSRESKALWNRLSDLTTAFGKMANLTTFSFVVSPYKMAIGFWIPRPIIASMVESLPKSCVNLEIDTRGSDYSEPGSVHLCDKIRKVLPRLWHFRLRLRVLCPAICAAGFNLDGTIKDESTFRPEVASKLKAVVINCVQQYYKKTARVCSTFKEDASYDYYDISREAGVALTKSLRQLFTRSNYPIIERMCLLDTQHPDDVNGAVWAAYNRRDIIQNKTWAIPFKDNGRFWEDGNYEKNSVIMHTPEGREVLSYQWAVEALAEGEVWKETFNGYRMPAAAIGTDDFQLNGFWAQPLPIESVESYRTRNPRRSCVLWRNERVTGLRLMGAVEREGLTDTSPVRELTPYGWRREEDGFLERDAQ